MNFSEFSSLLGVFLTGALAEVSLTLTQPPQGVSLRAFVDEALRAGQANRMRLREIQMPDRMTDSRRYDATGLTVTDSGDPSVIRFIYEPAVHESE